MIFLFIIDPVLRLRTMPFFVLLSMLLLLSGTCAAAPDGGALFTRHCSACHGFEGQGSVGIPLALPDFLAVADDDYLTKTIRHGRPGRVMPAFQSLSDEEIHAIIGYIRSWQPAVPPPSVDLSPVRGDAAVGRRLFQQNCQRCHGPNGRGGHGTGVTFSRPRALPVMPPALDNPGFQAAASDQFIKRTLRRGRKGTPMPSFLLQGLSETDLDNLVSYLRTLAHPDRQWSPPHDQPAILEYDSPYSVAQTVANIKRSVVGNNFRVIRIQPLEAGLRPEGQQRQDQVVIYFCNFDFADQALGLDPRVGLFLPCQITVLKTADGKVKVMSMNPKFMSRIYNNRELDDACNQMHDLYQKIMDEATI
jgi:cytochrome c oxidase cbb3-type subunit 3